MTSVHSSFSSVDVEPGQNGSRRTDVAAIMNDPNKPAAKPKSVTPPFVPGGTSRSVSDVMSLGRPLDRMPSSEENVSAATAA